MNIKRATALALSLSLLLGAAACGKSDSEAADSEVMNNFEIKEAPSRQESDRPAGEILDQDPGEGQQAVKGSVITVTVSAGGDNVNHREKADRLAF